MLLLVIEERLRAYKQSFSHSNKVCLYTQHCKYRVYIKHKTHNHLREVGWRKGMQQNPVGIRNFLLVVVGK